MSFFPGRPPAKSLYACLFCFRSPTGKVLICMPVLFQVTHWQSPYMYAYFCFRSATGKVLICMPIFVSGHPLAKSLYACLFLFQVTHWQSPYMHAYFPALNSFPSLLGDMLADSINCLGFTWVSFDYQYLKYLLYK